MTKKKSRIKIEDLDDQESFDITEEDLSRVRGGSLLLSSSSLRPSALTASSLKVSSVSYTEARLPDVTSSLTLTKK